MEILNFEDHFTSRSPDCSSMNFNSFRGFSGTPAIGTYKQKYLNNLQNKIKPSVGEAVLKNIYTNKKDGLSNGRVKVRK